MEVLRVLLEPSKRLFDYTSTLYKYAAVQDNSLATGVEAGYGSSILPRRNPYKMSLAVW
jgi:hypothetical protein